MQGRGHTVAVRSARRLRVQGFSLLELLVTMVVVAILASMALPNLMGLVNSNRLAAQANELVTSLQLARTEAIRRNGRVTFCRSEDGASCSTQAQGAWRGWIVVLDASNQLLRAGLVKPPVQLSSLDAAVTFRSDGLARAPAGQLANTTWVVCIAKAEPPQNQRAINLVSGSRISTQPVNGAGICP